MSSSMERMTSHILPDWNIYLVGGAITMLKNDAVPNWGWVQGWDDIPYMKWKIKLMFQTTNQKSLPFVYNLGTQRDFALPHYWRVTTKMTLATNWQSSKEV